MTYSKEFRREAIKLSDEISVKKAASQLGIPYYTLADWRYRRNGGRNVSIIREPMSEKEKDARIAERCMIAGCCTNAEFLMGSRKPAQKYRNVRI